MASALSTILNNHIIETIMTYTTYFLRFIDQEQAEFKLDEVGYKIEEIYAGETRTYFRVTDQVGDIDIVGEIYNNDAVIEFDENGSMEVITEPTKIEGYHVNIILEGKLPEELQEFTVTPQPPYRVFA